MRKYVAFLVAGAAILSGTAYAQSSVTLYGIVDAGLSFTSNANGPKQFALTSGNEGTTLWGLIGSEDLGGGLKAVFHLENGFLTTNGAITEGGSLFGRLAYVGLSGDFGTVTLGRQMATAYTFVGPLSAGGDWAAAGIGYGTHPGDVDNLDSFNRVSNAITYASPDYRGFTFGGQYSFGGQAGNFTQNEIISLGAGYTHGPLQAAIGYNLAKDPNFSFFNAVSNSTTGNNMTYSPVFSGYASARWQQIISAAVSYVLGPVTVGAVYSNTKFEDLGQVAVGGLTSAEMKYAGTVTFNSAELNIKYRPLPSLLLGAAYDYTKASDLTGQGGARYNQFNLGADYSLSRRTDIYLIGVYQIAGGTDSTGGPAVAAITAATPASGNRQLVVTAGITHKF